MGLNTCQNTDSSDSFEFESLIQKSLDRVKSLSNADGLSASCLKERLGMKRSALGKGK